MQAASVLSLLLLVSLFSAAGFAAALGGRAERIGAAILVMNTAVTLIAQALVSTAPLYWLLANDGLATLALAWLTFRYPDKLWPGLAACAQLLVTMFSVTRIIEFPLSETEYLVAVSICTVLGVSALAGGTLVSRFFPRDPSEWDVAYTSTARGPA